MANLPGGNLPPLPPGVWNNAPLSNAATRSLIFGRGPNPPRYPDYHICDKHYGENLYVSDCNNAAMSLVTNLRPTARYAASNPPPLTLPVTSSAGGCHMTIEVAGPSIPLITISRVDIAEMAFWVIDQCVVRENGLGGFVTKGIHRLIRYTMNPATVLTNPYPLDTYFMTLTISDTKAPGYGPGDNDPSVALAIASHNRLMNRNKNTHNSPAALKAEADEKAWTEQANRMGRGNNIPWWDFDPDAATHDEMNYECDANLGRPSRVDCTQIEWNQLTPASDTLTVGPGNALFLHSNTCYLAVSASIGIVLSWNQVRTAVAALTAMCVQAPFGPPQGGRAYHRPSAARPRIGRRSQNRDKLTGWNALPPHANITIFQQMEPWRGGVIELNSCTWKAVENRQSVGACH